MKSSNAPKRRRRSDRGRSARRTFAPLTEPLEGRQLLATTWYVNASASTLGANGSVANPFPTIQAAIGAATAGDTVDIAAGTYAESVQVTKSLTLDGPNAGVDPNTGTRAAEAVIVPPTAGTGTVVQVLADNVTIDGLTIDGDNPALNPTLGTILNGVPSFAVRGVANLSSAGGTLAPIGGMTVQNDIIRNFTLFGVLGDSPENPAGSPTFFHVSTGNTIAHNLIANVPTLPSTPTDTVNVGRGVSLEDDFYGSVTNNVMTKVAQGVQAITFINPSGVVDGLGNSVPFQIANNTISATDAGININLMDAGVWTYAVTNNQLTAATGADPWNTGLRVAHVLETNKLTLTANHIAGFQTGIELDYASATPAVTVTGGTISNVGVGVLMDNDNPPSGDVPPKANQAALAGVTITGASTAGIVVRDDRSNNVTANPAFTAPVVLTTDAQTTVTNSAEGVKLLMPPTSQYNPAVGGPTAILHDAGAPTITLTQTPPATSSSSSATFGYSTTDNLTTPGDMLVRYQLDGHAPVAASGGAVALSGLSAGMHSFAIQATDQAGNTVGTSYQWTVSPSQIAPPTLALTSGSDTGSSHSDGITANTTPTFQGTAAAGGAVVVYAGNTLLGMTTAGSDGSWSFTVGGPGAAPGVPVLADGSYAVTATVTANGATSSPSAAVTVVVDTTAPTPRLTSEPPLHTTQTTATFGYSGSDNVTAPSGLVFQYRLDNGPWVPASGGAVSLSNLALGTHTFALQATDQAGNSGGTSYQWAVAPSAPTLVLAPGSDTGSSHSDGITANTTPSFQGSAVPGGVVSVYAGAALLGTTTAGADGSWSFTVGGTGAAPQASRLADGSYAVFATVTVNGATSDRSASTALVVDDTPPNVNVTPLSALTTPTSAVFAYSGSDNVTAPAGLVFQYRFDRGPLLPATGGMVSLSDLSAGLHGLTVQATDQAGNVGYASYQWTVTLVQTAAPSIALAAGSDTGSSGTDGITRDNRPTFQGTAAPGSTVSVYTATALLGTTTAGTDGSWSFTVGGPGAAAGAQSLADGAYSIAATAQLPGQSTSQASPRVSLIVVTSAPTITLSRSVLPNAAGWNHSAVTVTYHATAPVPGVGLVSPASGSFTFTAQGANQSHMFTVTDVAGNTASVSTGPVNIDTEPPTRVTASVAPSSVWLKGTVLHATVSGTVADTLSGAGLSRYSIFDPHGELVAIGTFTPNRDGSYSVPLTIYTRGGTSAKGVYRIVIGGSDKAGNTTLASAAFVLS